MNAPRASEKSNNVRNIREGLLMSKSELARKAGISVLTISRVEKGFDCRLETKRKILKALGYSIEEREKVF
jgi:predicted transcriptional regulator